MLEATLAVAARCSFSLHEIKYRYPLETVLPAAPGQRRGHVTVQLSATMTEVGTLEMHCTHADDPA